MTADDFENAKHEMKNYRDTFGKELRTDLIDNAKSIIDLERIFNFHIDNLNTCYTQAQENLENFKQKILNRK